MAHSNELYVVEKQDAEDDIVRVEPMAVREKCSFFYLLKSQVRVVFK